MNAPVTNLDKLFDEATPIVSRADAKALGLKRYFTGKPCKRGHVAERFVSVRTCVDCKIRDRPKSWGNFYFRHKDSLLDKRRAQYAASPEKHRNASRAWASKNRDKVRDRDRMYAANNPEKVRHKWAKRRSRKRLAIIHTDAAKHRKSLAKRGGNCFYCGEYTSRYEQHVDHLIPLSRGGPEAAINLVRSCPACNLSKNDRLPSEWAGLPEKNKAAVLNRELDAVEWNNAQILGDN